MKRLPGTILATFCAAIVVSACGTQVATVQPGSSAPAAVSPRQRAEADATAILASFVPPAGARRLTAAPGAGGGALRQPIQVPGGNLVDDVSWWLAPGPPEAVLAWEQAHLPARFATAGSAEASGRDGLYEWSHEFSLPPVPAVLDSRELVVQVVSAGANQTAIRVDSQVTWLPAKPAAERVPAGTVSVTISEVTGAGTKPPAPVAVTDKATLRKIVSLADALPVFPPGIHSCPPSGGLLLELAFRDAGGGVLAVVDANQGGCGTVSFIVGGTSTLTLWHGASFVRQVLEVAGLHW